MTPPPRLLHLLGQISRARSAFEFARASRRPGETQRARLRAILRPNADTEYGRAHGFGDIRDPATFARRVPIMRPADLQPWVERLQRGERGQGERGLLTGEAPLAYVTTTGSTGPAKYVPITASYRTEFQKTVHVAVWHLYRRFPEAFHGRVLYFVGSRRTRVAPDGLDIGAMSGFNFTELPPVVRAAYAWPYELFEVPDLATRGFLALYLAAVRDVTLIAGVFPAPIVYMLRNLVREAPRLAEHVRRGSLPDDLTLTDAQRAFFSRDLGPRPDVADRLARIPDEARNDPSRAVALAMPRLRLTYCWMTSTAGLFVPELQERLGPSVAVRDAIYAACEGWCSIPIGDDAPGGALAITSHFFEFFEVQAHDRGDLSDPRTAEQLEDGRQYYIVVTNSAGLYRYLLGDIVEVCGHHHRTPRIRFVRKAGAASDLCGEKLEEHHVTDAVGAALASLGLRATWFSLVPVTDEVTGAAGHARGGAELRYELYIELAEPAPGGAVDAFGGAVDGALRAHAQGYDFCRSGGLLGAARVRRLPAGRYDAWRQIAVAEGAAEAQLKTAHLVSCAGKVPPALRPSR